MQCTVCKRPVVLVPSARERAARYGGTAADYVRLFPVHAECTLRVRAAETADLCARIRSAPPPYVILRAG